MRRNALLLATIFAVFTITTTPALAEPTNFTLDKNHAYIGFEIDHLGLSSTVGRFNDFDGIFEIDEKNPAASKINFKIKASSIDSNHAARDVHVRSADFLNVTKYPEMQFVSTGVTMVTPSTGKLNGNLTLLGVTKPVTLDFRMTRDARYPAFVPGYDEIRAVGFEASGSILRMDYGMNFAGFVGGPVGLEVKIKAKFDLVDCAGKPASNVACHWGR